MEAEDFIMGSEVMINTVTERALDAIGNYEALIVSLRIAADVDTALLAEIYRDSRVEEMQQVSHWGDAEKTEFLNFQFNAQYVHYRQYYPGAEYLIIEYNGLDVGRLFIERREQEMCIMDIAILHPYRRRGLARKLITELLAEACQKHQRVVLHVEPDNVAKRLYIALGFKVVGEISFYQRMEWQG